MAKNNVVSIGKMPVTKTVSGKIVHEFDTMSLLKCTDCDETEFQVILVNSSVDDGTNGIWALCKGCETMNETRVLYHA